MINAEVEFMEAINGTKKVIQFGRTETCSTCNGSQCKPGTSPTTCGGCGGQGF